MTSLAKLSLLLLPILLYTTNVNAEAVDINRPPTLRDTVDNQDLAPRTHEAIILDFCISDCRARFRDDMRICREVIDCPLDLWKESLLCAQKKVECLRDGFSRYFCEIITEGCLHNIFNQCPEYGICTANARQNLEQCLDGCSGIDEPPVF